MKPEVLNERPITMAEMKEEIEKIKKRDNELNFRATKTEEYLQQFEIISTKKSEELMKSIWALKVPRLKDEHIVKIIDLYPKTTDEVKSILSCYTFTVTQENLKKILSKLEEK
jgi:DNA-directed RNA polymerase subunit F